MRTVRGLKLLAVQKAILIKSLLIFLLALTRVGDIRKNQFEIANQPKKAKHIKTGDHYTQGKNINKIRSLPEWLQSHPINYSLSCWHVVKVGDLTGFGDEETSLPCQS